MLVKVSHELYDSLKIPTLIAVDDTEEFHLQIQEDLPSGEIHGMSLGMVNAGVPEKKLVQIKQRDGSLKMETLVSGKILVKRQGIFQQVGGMHRDVYGPDVSIEDLLNGGLKL